MKAWLLIAAVVAALLIVAAALLMNGQLGADASVLSRRSSGWLAARRYLEERGCRTELRDHGLDDRARASDGVLVLAFPWQSQAAGDSVEAGVAQQLQRGGTVVFAYSGRVLAAGESLVAEALGLGWEDRRGRPPLNPWRWRKYAAQEQPLLPEAGGSARRGRVTAPRRVPRAPQPATILARDGSGLPLAFSCARGRGRVVVLPADAFSNARLGQPGNADLLETLRQELGDRWVFDEFHHGLRPAFTAAARGSQRVLLLYLLQLGFVYVLVVVAVARRFGPAWREGVPALGSAAGFLVGLGAMHERLGHQREAAELLISRARALDGRLVLPSASEADTTDLLGLARRVGQAQLGRTKGV